MRMFRLVKWCAELVWFWIRWFILFPHSAHSSSWMWLMLIGVWCLQRSKQFVCWRMKILIGWNCFVVRQRRWMTRLRFTLTFSTRVWRNACWLISDCCWYVEMGRGCKSFYSMSSSKVKSTPCVRRSLLKRSVLFARSVPFSSTPPSPPPIATSAHKQTRHRSPFVSTITSAVLVGYSLVYWYRSSCKN